MEKNIFKVTLVAAIALFAGYNLSNSQKTVELSDLALANVEVLAGDDYVIGVIGTNWKEYRIECQRTTGFDYILVMTTTYWADVCGYGSGTCMSPAGC